MVVRVGSSSSYGLLGCEITSPRHRNIADSVSFSAFRVTEVLEWAIWRAEESGYGGRGGRQEGGVNARSKSGQGVGTFGRSLLTGLFNLGGGSSKGGAVGGQEVEVFDGSSGGISQQCVDPSRFVKMRAALCPHKLRVAMTLADLGEFNLPYPFISPCINPSCHIVIYRIMFHVAFPLHTILHPTTPYTTLHYTL